MFRLTATEETSREGRAIAEFFAQLPRHILRERRTVQTSVLRGFQRNFTNQSSSGNAPWQPLALVTQRERRRKGYGAARPILVRSGQYRSSFVNAGDANHHSSAEMDGNIAVFEEGSDAMPYHEMGTSRMPARPVTALSAGSRADVTRVLDWIVGQLERRTLRR